MHLTDRIRAHNHESDVNFHRIPCVCVCESAFIYNQYRSPAGGIYLSSQRRL
jgi:hypothetical protein